MDRTIVVDDEPLARAHIRSLLAGAPDIEVLEECGTGAEAVAAILRLAPDLVLLDIQMPELDGFGVIRAVGVDRMPPVVLVSAHDEFALRAFDVHAIDYVLKPVGEQRLLDAVSRAVRWGATRSGGPAAALAAGNDLIAGTAIYQVAGRDVPPLAGRTNGHVTFVRPEEIDWVEAMDNYVRVHAGSRVHTFRETLSHVVERLPPDQFVRVHRSTVVNVRRIRELHSLPGARYIVVLADGTRLAVGRRNRAAIQAVLRKSL
jgi:two-component system LytT family response regulator